MRRVLIPSKLSPEQPMPGSVIHDVNGLTMGTSWLVRFVDRNQPFENNWQANIQQQLDAVVKEMSHWLPSSDLGRFNQAPADTWHQLPEAFFEVLSYAMTIAADTKGAYNPIAGALINTWGFGPSNRYDESGFVPPSLNTIQTILQKSNWQQVELDPSHRRAYQPGEALIDLSSIAKGYAVDKIAHYLSRHGIQHYLVEVGGELRGAGMKPDGQPWWVALESPLQLEKIENGKTTEKVINECVVALHGLAVATSGDYRRNFQFDGKLYPHTLDPRNGFPISTGLASVTVLHESCMAADALSTALTVLGIEDGMRFAEARKLPARFLIRNGNGFVERATTPFLEMCDESGD